MPRQTKPVTDPRLARAKEEKRLDALARRITKAAEKIRLAATYHGDGAYETARTRIHEARWIMRNADRYLGNNAWHVKAEP